MGLAISHQVRINSREATRDGQALSIASWPLSPEDLYRSLGCQYPRFFKMDTLCKWAWLGAEILLSTANQQLYKDIDKAKAGLVLATSHGCLDADKKYQESMGSIPSPALFVYTLPNIMLGELCIRHGFKGEQFSIINERIDINELEYIVTDLLEKRGMDACLYGWIDVVNNDFEVCLFWAVS